MNVIHRDIYVTQHQRIQPIDIVRGSQVGIELQLMDYNVPAGASAKAYARGKYTADTYPSNCTVSGNTVSFTPPDGFFIPGPNRLQIEINGVIISFSIDVNCESRISDAGDPATPEQVTPLVTRAETAASAADSAQKAVEAVRSELEKNYPAVPELNAQVDGMEKSLIQNNGLNIATAYGSFLSKFHNGITYSWEDDHTGCIVDGTAEGTSFNNVIVSKDSLPYGVVENQEIYFDVTSTSPNVFIKVHFYNDSGEYTAVMSLDSSQWVKVPETSTGINVRVEVTNGATVANDVVTVAIYKSLPGWLQAKYLSSEIEKRIYSKSANPYAIDNSLTLGNIREDGHYVINPSLTITDAPAGFSPTGLTVNNFSAEYHGVAYVKQIVEDVTAKSNKRYYRYSTSAGVFRKWIEDYEPGSNEPNNNFLAAPNDGRDMTGAIQAMLDTTGICHLGPGVFYTTGINIPARGMLAGSGNNTMLVLADSVVSGYAVKINTHGCIKDLMIGGTESPSTAIALSEIVGERHGILFQGEASIGGKVPYRSTIHNVAIYNFSGGGITCTDTGYSVASCLNVSDVYIFWCGAGINIPYWSEFNRFSNVSVDGCYYGCINNGGNNVFANCGFSGNTVGVLMDNSTGQSKNNSHGTYTGCVFNHSGKNTGVAIKLLGITNGELFNACQLFFGKIVIDGCEGIRLDCFNVGRKTPISISNSKGIFLNGWMLHSKSETPITKDDSVVIVSNCYTRSGTQFTI